MLAKNKKTKRLRIEVLPGDWRAFSLVKAPGLWRIIFPTDDLPCYLDKKGRWTTRDFWHPKVQANSRREIIGRIRKFYHVIEEEPLFGGQKNYLIFIVGDRKKVKERTLPNRVLRFSKRLTRRVRKYAN
jgi:hypothetical protein